LTKLANICKVLSYTLFNMPSIKFRCERFDCGFTEKLGKYEDTLKDWKHDVRLGSSGELILYFHDITIEQVSQVRKVVKDLGIISPQEKIVLHNEDHINNVMNLLLKDTSESYAMECLITLLNGQVKKGTEKHEIICDLDILFQACHWVRFNANRIEYVKFFTFDKPERTYIFRLIKSIAKDNNVVFNEKYIITSAIKLIEDIDRIKSVFIGKENPDCEFIDFRTQSK